MAQCFLLPLQQRAVASFSLCNSCLSIQRVLPATLTVVSASRPQRLSQVLQLKAAQGAVLGVEPDLVEDYIEGSEYWTPGQDKEDDFPYGKVDGAHSWHEGDDNRDLFEAIGEEIKIAGGPNDHPGQATISWIYLPIIFGGLALGVQIEYLVLVCVLFIFAFIGIEMSKPDQPSNFLPDVYRQSRRYEERYEVRSDSSEGFQ